MKHVLPFLLGLAPIIGLMFLLTGCGLLHPGSSATPFGQSAPMPQAITGSDVAAASALKPVAALPETNAIVIIPHVTLVWNNAYLTNADGSVMTNEFTQVYATDSLTPPAWQLMQETQAGFLIVPRDRPTRFFRVANIFH